MSRRARWVLIVTVAALVAAFVLGRSLLDRRNKPLPANATATAPVQAQALELTPGDVVRATRSELVHTLAVSGGLKAVDSAMLKAKVAAEVRSIDVREGDRVQAGQLLGRLDDTEFQLRVRQAEDQARAAQAQLDIAERSLANNKALVDQGFISRTALDTSISNAGGARASLQAAHAAADLMRKSLRDTELRAPLSGLISQRLVNPGERVGLDARLIEIVNLDRLELEAAVPAEDVVAVRVGQQAQVVVDGLPKPVAATVTRINPSTQSGSRSVMTYLALKPAPALRQGLFARGSIELARRQALVVPVGAVHNDQSRPYVLVALNGLAHHRVVELGEQGQVDFGAGREAAVELLSGVAEGDTVLRGTVGMLPAGSAVVVPGACAASASASVSAATGTSASAGSAPRP
jgi:membrane fusion protein, multidrug efflux system